jgi:hypothetical protein
VHEAFLQDSGERTTWNMSDFQLQTQLTPRKFYSIEYFYIFLRSISETNSANKSFELFRSLKEELALGDSKFKTLAKTKGDPTKRQLERFRYTFTQVAEESRDYDLVAANEDGSFDLTKDGEKVLSYYGTPEFRAAILERMERRFQAFRYLLRRMYENTKGILLFPLYSPLDLGIQKQKIVCAKDVAEYGRELQARIYSDIKSLTDRDVPLPDANAKVLPRLKESKQLPVNDNDPFARNEYTAIISRYRKFWFSYLLQSVYGVELAESTFEIWAYRGKQLGTVNVTEQYPGMSGRLVYPVSVISREAKSKDFFCAFKYKDDCLWLHEPKEESFLNTFVDSLTEAYLGQRRSAKSYFASLYVVREIVCLRCKISEKIFETLLNAAYERSIRGELRIRISLEVDRTPGETTATYLRREPIFVRSQPYNILGLDFASSIENVK